MPTLKPIAPPGLLGRFMRRQLSRRITTWFHEEGVDETLFEVAHDFLDLLPQQGLNLEVSEKSFRRSLCEAICVMRYSGNVALYPSNRRVYYPEEWTEELETLWQNWLSSNIFTTTFWHNFWSRHLVQQWESAMAGWRGVFEELLPTYVRRSMELFVAQGLFVEDEDGGFTETPMNDDEWVYGW